MDYITKSDPLRKFNPYATLCGDCHRLRAMWSLTHGILIDKECRCTSKEITSNTGDSLYD